MSKLIPQANNLDKWWFNIKNNDDLSSFQELHSHLYPSLVEFAFSYLKVKEICEEVVDDVFVNLWNKRSEITHVRNIKSFLFTCTRNRAIDYLRKNNKEPLFDDNIFQLKQFKLDDDIATKLENEEFIQNLQEAVNLLPNKCKIIFKMHLNDNLSNAEIAEVLGLAKKTIEAQLYIAYRKLTTVLKKIYLE